MRKTDANLSQARMMFALCSFRRSCERAATWQFSKISTFPFLCGRFQQPSLHPSLMGLTDFLGEDKLGRESLRGGHHAKRIAHLYEGIQAGSGALSAKEWQVASANRP